MTGTTFTQAWRAVRTVLPHPGDEDARPPALLARESFHIAANGGEVIIALIRAAIDTRHGPDLPSQLP
ncbi:MAG TPA: hypothetical protein VMF67_13485 [Rhizomicrobium sp.]|nr:hypothetical protein [Rhizomicrobium sp.]